MKLIDIHTKKEIINSERCRNNISNSLVRGYVFQNLRFSLTEQYWVLIESIFSEIWNNKLGIGGQFYWDEISKDVFAEIKKKKILIEYEKVNETINLILTYIENTGGFLE